MALFEIEHEHMSQQLRVVSREKTFLDAERPLQASRLRSNHGFGSNTSTSFAALSTASLLNGKMAGVPVRQASNWSL